MYTHPLSTRKAGYLHWLLFQIWSILSTHMAAYNHLQLQFQGDQCLLTASVSTVYIWCRQIQAKTKLSFFETRFLHVALAGLELALIDLPASALPSAAYMSACTQGGHQISLQMV